MRKSARPAAADRLGVIHSATDAKSVVHLRLEPSILVSSRSIRFRTHRHGSMEAPTTPISGVRDSESDSAKRAESVRRMPRADADGTSGSAWNARLHRPDALLRSMPKSPLQAAVTKQPGYFLATLHRDEVELGAQAQLGVALGPVVVDAVGLFLHPRLEVEVVGRGEVEALEQVQGRGLVVAGEVLVEDEDRLDPGVLEEGVPGGLLDQQFAQQVVDRPVVEAQLRPVLLDEGAVGRRAVVLDRDRAGVTPGPRARSPSAPPSRARPPGAPCWRGRRGRRSGPGRPRAAARPAAGRGRRGCCGRG